MRVTLLIFGCLYLVVTTYLFDRLCDKLEHDGTRYGLSSTVAPGIDSYAGALQPGP